MKAPLLRLVPLPRRRTDHAPLACSVASTYVAVDGDTRLFCAVPPRPHAPPPSFPTAPALITSSCRAPPAGVGNAFAGWDDTDDDTDDGGAGKRRNWAALDAGQARAAQEREALAAAAIRLQANARRGGEQDGPHEYYS